MAYQLYQVICFLAHFGDDVGLGYCSEAEVSIGKGQEDDMDQ